MSFNWAHCHFTCTTIIICPVSKMMLSKLREQRSLHRAHGMRGGEKVSDFVL